MARLLDRYRSEIRPQLMAEFGYDNLHQAAALDRIVVNVGLGEAIENDSAVENTVRDVATITGQRPVVTRAKKSVAAFKLREGERIGVKATVRGVRMYEFLDRLVSIAIPRIRDFRGLNPKSFDRQGNYSMGVSEQIIFPEVNYDEIDAIRGLDITISTTAKNADDGRALLDAFNLPFKK